MKTITERVRTSCLTMLVLACGSTPALAANYGYYAPPPAASPYASPYTASPYTVSPYMGSPYRGSPYPASPYMRSPYQASPYMGAPRQYGPRPGYAPGYGYPPRSYGGGPRGRRGNSGWGPMGNRDSSWGPMGNRDNWGRFRNPFKDRDLDDWFSLDKDDMAENWEDMINAPSRAGTMPGGWEAPYVSVPNPIDIGDEFEESARDVPDQIKDSKDNFDFNYYK